MKVALLAPDSIASKVEPIVKTQMDSIELKIYIYNDYIEVLDILNKIQSKYDGIMFAGIISYYLAKQNIKEEVMWEYFQLHESSLLNALFQAQYFNENIKDLSIDTYSKSNLKQIFDMVGVNLNDTNIKLYELNLENYRNLNEEALEFHKKNLKENKNVCIVTALSKVNNELKNMNIKNYMAIPTESVIMDSFERLYLKYTAKVNKNSQLVSMFIEIDLPSEYSLISKNEYYYIREKNKVSDIVYEFGRDIEATIVEVSFNTYLLFTTKEIIERKTNNFKEISILDWISQKSLHIVSIGIGYGKTAIEAKYNSNIAMIKAKKYDENTAYVVYEDGISVGPINNVKRKKKEKIDEKILEIATKTNLNINKILKIYNVVDKYKIDCFTTSELSKYCGISIRSTNRMLNRLEECNYIDIVGKQFPDGAGRPKRIMKFKF
ncbi:MULTISPECIES: winged helix-turn-helix domain-containing protein [Terrisporobacter]|uniref:Transcriptional regulator n=2 Tax=Terrisporobacter TaxID=1505652 RepID=A0A0B3VNQ0_9FIRM|nr:MULTISPECIES: winged helix-turn-helix domain-containing protein [Terrisporobacter]KHS58426.1 hypothetical protein QX51_02685 [Terrisporobacter othiniensis]MCC3669276.1 winged helix-turn-helix domain-containing protein [Terrisporobacter mayombei]MCR1825066.1 winged helix-turn-helix domain-containing protein [Terrisporobacter muris]MDU6983698.1 winged helix-turn-helix domain-containing protein [Terrisporobacter othiniensis]MDY3374401.1 winged helix-turn-helix domain-containing protein [Terris